jgi:hypothetical protein
VQANAGFSALSEAAETNFRALFCLALGTDNVGIGFYGNFALNR